jgi:glucose/arabinose dehydrogenase
MRRFHILKALLTVFIFFFLSAYSLAAPPANFQATQIIGSGLDVPSGFDFAPDGRIFILERTGEVKIYKNGTLLSTPFTKLDSAASGDRGLVGIAFDPDYANNHFVYFYYTGTDTLNHLVRMDASSDIATAPPTILYETTVASLELHIGGTIRFASDGKLYVSVGDNGTPSNAQDLSTPYGKILRLNKDGTIPSDNPFVGQAGKLPEIWAYGFRNPFRFQFDSVSGRLYVGDVGDFSWEEVNLVTKGSNYGWPTCEGNCSNPNFKNPIYTYPHNNQSAAVAGGPVYRGGMFPSDYLGKYFFADYAQGFIKTLTLDANGNSTGVSTFDPSAGAVVDLKVAPDGSIYYINYFPGSLFRITHSSFNQFPTAKASADKNQGPPGVSVSFSSAGSSDPENQTLTYDWKFGDGTSSTDANPAKTYPNKGRYTIQLTVSDGVNQAQATPLIVQVGTPPTVNITSPSDGATYKAGDTLSYAGSGTDASGSALLDSAFTTNIVLHHGTHIHPFLGPVQSKSGQFTIPTFGEASTDTHYEIMMTGTDSDGLQSTKSVNIFPQKVDLTFSANPSALQILLDGTPTDTPVTIPHVIGFQRTLSVPAYQELNSKNYIFSSWSDGGKIIHKVTTPQQATTYTANFSVLPSFTAQFFNNLNLSGSPVLTRQDPKIDFNWNEGSPGTGVNTDNFSTRWTNSVFFAGARYRFITTSDDGVRLFIDNQLVIDKWIGQSATTYYADVDLTSGNHSIKFEYFDSGGDALAKLIWDLSPTQSPPSSTTPTPTPTPGVNPTPTPTPPPAFLGYKGEYWNTPGAGSSPTIPSSTPNLTRDDASINFDWGNSSPDPVINPDHFVVRWTKTETFESSTYRFTGVGDDGIRAYLDNQLIIDKWIDQPPTSYSVDKVVTAGNHNIKFEFYENGVGAVAKFSFQKIAGVPTPTPTPTATPTPTPVANTPTPTPTPSQQVQGLTGEYFDNIDLTNLKLKRTDASVNFNWGESSPISAISPDTFSVRWTGQVQPQYSQTYTFYTTTDDGVRLWVNNQLIIDKWVNQSAKEWSGKIALTAGQKYSIKMEFYDNTYDAFATLSWSSSSRAKQIIPQNRLFTP